MTYPHPATRPHGAKSLHTPLRQSPPLTMPPAIPAIPALARPLPQALSRRDCLRLALATSTLAALPGLARGAAPQAELPAALRQLMRQRKLPADSLSWVVDDLTTGDRVLSWQADTPRNPASLTKLLTTLCALESLGPTWTWKTEIWRTGPLIDGVVQGDLVLVGDGDPKLQWERLWLLVQRLRQAGIRGATGGLLLDRSRFDLPPHDPGAFDNEPLRPANAGPDALLMQFQSLQLRFTPDADTQQARVAAEPSLPGFEWPSAVPLNRQPCGSWREQLKLRVEAQGLALDGSYPAACGSLNWPILMPAEARFPHRLMAGLLQDAGIQLGSPVTDGLRPPESLKVMTLESPPLAEVIRDINKFSNNVMAEQLFLTLPRGSDASPVSWESAQAALRRWVEPRLGWPSDSWQVLRGSGLSRDTRLSAAQLAHVLMAGWQSPLMPEYAASLALAGQDGTMTRLQSATGSAHLKSGSLRDSAALAGYVQSRSGRRHSFVAILQAPQAGEHRAVLDQALSWVHDR
ncbi:MAG: D-alanyl-D-alanine carboxypeptidase/D-alanyl-D-alanine-endopeptidase [Burkholderiaceae bacterium]|nr:MAG: D-alanyl-D-alanine carboxypeptidase/D-alanyl-D-alanine-endopeptidase [Burkholderiaceae bacterium]